VFDNFFDNEIRLARTASGAVVTRVAQSPRGLPKTNTDKEILSQNATNQLRAVLSKRLMSPISEGVIISEFETSLRERLK
jgi:hypothetical protein